MNPTRQHLFVSIKVIKQRITLLAYYMFFRLPFLKIHTKLHITASQGIDDMKTVIIGTRDDKIVTKCRHIKFILYTVILE